MIKLITEKFQEWMRYRVTVQELAQLSDRELADLGICRGDIHIIAKQSVWR